MYISDYVHKLLYWKVGFSISEGIENTNDEEMIPNGYQKLEHCEILIVDINFDDFVNLCIDLEVYGDLRGTDKTFWSP